MSRYEVFLLDADDTLFDFTACCKNALKKSMQDCKITYKEEYHKQYMQTNSLLWERLEKKEITHAQLFSLRFSEFLTVIGEDSQKSEMLNRTYVTALSKENVSFKGAREFLEKLKTLGKVYVITNGTAVVQRGRFEKFNLKKYVENIFISEEIGSYKPSKDFFSYIEKSLPSLKREKTLIIGDSLTSDIALANAVGIDCVWFNPENKPLKDNIFPTFTAKKYEEILGIIQF